MRLFAGTDKLTKNKLLTMEGWIEKREWVNHLDPDPQTYQCYKRNSHHWYGC